MKCQVKSKGKFFIVVDPVHHKSFTLNNKLSAEDLKGLLDNYYEKNKMLSLETQLIKHIVKDAYITERTALGKSVLRQLAERIGVEVIREG